MTSTVIVVGIPDPSTGDFPLQRLRDVAQRMDARIVLAHAVQQPAAATEARTGVIAVSPFRSQHVYQAEVMERVQQVSHLAEQLRRDGLEVATWVERGDPVPALLGLARREQADIIAVAAHGRLGPRARPIGSVASQLLRDADRPVLVLQL